jgi:hypothetical protein
VEEQVVLGVLVVVEQVMVDLLQELELREQQILVVVAEDLEDLLEVPAVPES